MARSTDSIPSIDFRFLAFDYFIALILSPFLSAAFSAELWVIFMRTSQNEDSNPLIEQRLHGSFPLKQFIANSLSWDNFPHHSINFIYTQKNMASSFYNVFRSCNNFALQWKKAERLQQFVRTKLPTKPNKLSQIKRHVTLLGQNAP